MKVCRNILAIAVLALVSKATPVRLLDGYDDGESDSGSAVGVPPKDVTTVQPMVEMGDQTFIDIRVSCQGFDYSKDKNSEADLKASIQLSRPLKSDIVQETETVTNAAECDFSKLIRLPFSMTERAAPTLRVYDINMSRESEVMFSAEFKMNDLVAKMNRRENLIVYNEFQGKESTCTLTATPAADGSLILMDVQIVNLKWKSNPICMSDADTESGPRFYLKTPFVTGAEEGARSVYESEDIKKDFKKDVMEYKQFGIHSAALGHERNPNGVFTIVVVCRPSKPGREMVVIGETKEMSITDLVEPKGALTLEVVRTETPGATIVIKAEAASSYAEYLAAGMQYKLHAALDFTGSNGPVTLINSLHYVKTNDGRKTNQYLDGGKMVYESLAAFTKGSEMALWEFGGRELCKPRRGVFDMKELCTGGENVIKSSDEFEATYIAALEQYKSKTRELGAGTYFAPVINAIAAQVQKTETQPIYHVLTIMTDGIINDMQNTKDAIVKASGLPMSILIVGVGGADFSNMEELDGDDEPLLKSSTKAHAVRDMVNFTPLQDFIGKPRLGAFESELLSEVPLNVVQYYHNIDVLPAHLEDEVQFRKLIDAKEATMQRKLQQKQESVSMLVARQSPFSLADPHAPVQGSQASSNAVPSSRPSQNVNQKPARFNPSEGEPNGNEDAPHVFATAVDDTITVGAGQPVVAYAEAVPVTGNPHRPCPPYAEPCPVGREGGKCCIIS